MHLRRLITIPILVLLASSTSFSKGGGHSLGAGIIFASPDQEDINNLIERANARVGGISTKQLTSAYEFFAFWMYRFNGTMYAIQFRPSYFIQSQSGSGTGGTYAYNLSGFTVFPIFRLYALENSFMKFFLQSGIGYGRINGKIEEAGATVEFAGGNFGMMGGAGAEFCFVPSHCIVVEGNLRYLPIDRNITTSSTGTFASDSISQNTVDHELEYNNQDLRTTLGGFQAVVEYTFHF